MALTHAARLQTTTAFDGVAAGYHRANVENSILREMRRRVVAALTTHVSPPAHILDLGCGPGTDEEYLGRAGYRVTGIDGSPEMIAQARARVAAAGLRSSVTVRNLALEEIEALAPARFDAVLSNFGPLNCVADLDRIAASLYPRLCSGGILVASVIGRFCPVEIALFLSRANLSRARIRFAADFVPVPLERHTVWTRYYSPREFQRVFVRAGFSRVSLRALGVLVPPPYAHAFAGRHPRLTRAMLKVEDMVAAWPGVRSCGDHFLIVMRRR